VRTLFLTSEDVYASTSDKDFKGPEKTVGFGLMLNRGHQSVGFERMVEVEPKQWRKAADLPDGLIAQATSRGKLDYVVYNGRVIDRLNINDPAERHTAEDLGIDPSAVFKASSEPLKAKTCVSLSYMIPFVADKVNAQFALKEKLLNIEGTAIDTSVNTNKWAVPEEDLDFFVETLRTAQLRVDHAESAMAVVGKVTDGRRVGNQVFFRAEVGDLPIIERVLRGYINSVSAQVDSDDVECSKCRRQTRKEGILVHLCPGAYEIVHKPRVRELSIVASPAYQTTVFKPVGFAAAMDNSQLTVQALMSKIQSLTTQLQRERVRSDMMDRVARLKADVQLLYMSDQVDRLGRKVEKLSKAKRARKRVIKPEGVTANPLDFIVDLGTAMREPRPLTKKASDLLCAAEEVIFNLHGFEAMRRRAFYEGCKQFSGFMSD
jgi:hypothetical protein